MNIVIAGDGEVGIYLARLLSNENHRITIIDPKSDFIKSVENENNILAINADPTSIDILRDIELNRKDLFISVVRDEKTNIITAALAKKLGVKECIARISNPEYLLPENYVYFKEFGIDHLVCPENIAAEEILLLLNETGATEIVNFSQGQLSLVLIKIPKNSNFIGKQIKDISVIENQRIIRVVAIHRNDKTIIPKDEDTIMANDYVYILAKASDVENLIEMSGIEKYPINNVMIIGGSRIGVKTAQRLEKRMNVKLIEIDKQKTRKISEILNNTLIIHGDGRDKNLLLQEEIEQMDALIAATESSETNILICLIAKHLGVRKVIPLIDQVEYIDIAQHIDLDITINKKIITASHIATHTMKAKVATVKHLYGIEAEVMEFVAQPKSRATRKPIRHIGVPDGAIIAGIVRDKKGYIASGDFQIMENDYVVVFALPEAYNKVQTLFQ